MVVALVLAACGTRVDVERALGRDTNPTASTRPGAPAKPTVYRNLHFVDAQHGFAQASTDGQQYLLSTEDGGAAWSRLPLPTDGDVYFRSPRSGWIMSAVCQSALRKPPPLPSCQATIARTDDGGRSWRELTRFPESEWRGAYPIASLRFVDDTTGWMLERSDRCSAFMCNDVLRSTDGGRSWEKVNDRTLPVHQLEVIGASRLWAVGADSLLFSADGGATWDTRLRVPTDERNQPMFRNLVFANSGRGWALANNLAACSMSQCGDYSLYRTDDGGAHWAPLRSPRWMGPCGGILTDARFAGDAGWIGLNHGAGGALNTWGVLRSSDGGDSWTCHPSALAFLEIEPLDDRRAVAVVEGHGLMLSADGGATWTDAEVR